MAGEITGLSYTRRRGAANWSQTKNAIESNGSKIYYAAKDCEALPDEMRVNAIISEILNVIKDSGELYDSSRLDNLAIAIKSIVLKYRFAIPDNIILYSRENSSVIVLAAEPKKGGESGYDLRYIPIQDLIANNVDVNSFFKQQLPFADDLIGQEKGMFMLGLEQHFNDGGGGVSYKLVRFRDENLKKELMHVLGSAFQPNEPFQGNFKLVNEEEKKNIKNVLVPSFENGKNIIKSFPVSALSSDDIFEKEYESKPNLIEKGENVDDKAILLADNGGEHTLVRGVKVSELFNRYAKPSISYDQSAPIDSNSVKFDKQRNSFKMPVISNMHQRFLARPMGSFSIPLLPPPSQMKKEFIDEIRQWGEIYWRLDFFLVCEDEFFSKVLQTKTHFCVNLNPKLSFDKTEGNIIWQPDLDIGIDNKQASVFSFARAKTDAYLQSVDGASLHFSPSIPSSSNEKLTDTFKSDLLIHISNT